MQDEKKRIKTLQAWHTWLSEPLGQSLITAEAQKIDSVLARLFGYHLILLGESSFLSLIEKSSILHRVCVNEESKQSKGNQESHESQENKENKPAAQVSTVQGSELICRQDKLSLLSDEADCVLLAHALERHRNPHEVLREVLRILKPEGYLIITGFNPWSLWGVWRLLLRYVKRRPWDAQFIAVSRLKDWLALLGFDLVKINRCVFFPPISNPKMLSRLRWMETLGRWIYPFWGGAYVVIAQKRVITLTPIKSIFEKSRRLLSPGFAEPVTRGKGVG